MHARCLFAVLASALILTTGAWAQPAAGRIAGVLSDPSGAVVPGGRISATNSDSGLTRTALSDRMGSFAFDGLPAGHYRVMAAAAGFAASTREDVVVAAGMETTVHFALAIGQSKTVVEVNGPAEALAEDAIATARSRTSDTASLFSGLPGLALAGGGGVSSLPVLDGMADDRVNVLVNGMTIAPACSGHMNPPASNVSPASVDAVRVMAGVAPVSEGGDNIGGTIALETAAPQFGGSGQGLAIHGGVTGFHRTNGVVNGGNAWLSAATERFRIGYTGSYVNANDYTDGAGAMVKSTFYETQNHALEMAARRGNNLFTIDLGYQRIPQQGFANARMDMTRNEAKFLNAGYSGAFRWGELDARVYYQNTRHEMNILRDKIPGMDMPMDTRGANLGTTVQTEIPLSSRDTLRAGTEFRRFTLDDWWPPVMMMVGSMGPDTLWNVRDGRRDRFAAYAEWETRRGRGWTEMIGVRGELVRMNAGDVAGYNSSTTTMGSAAYAADAAGFNAANHFRQDLNLDLTAVARYQPRGGRMFEFGYARKTRSPSIYERYLWVKQSSMSADMNGWFGDGNGYTGNLNLRPEVANTFSATAGFRSMAHDGWELKITPYYTRVEDYIDVDPVMSQGMMGGMAAHFDATCGFVTLQFANHAARLYGADASWRAPLGGGGGMGRFSLVGVFGYVRGQNLDTGGNLYEMMPVHGNVALEHRRGNWSSALDFQAVDAKTDVSAVRNELRTPGYALLNLRSGYRWKLGEATGVRLDAGVDNLTNRQYALPLSGRYWVGDKTGNTQVPGMGRSIYTGMTFEF
ncbi:MAG TPA: carboxypeptidase regulatory-like domain-containing protein [Bryobacteraceae bacterium]|nr:carboxypeptidase regulatory-like domain-containing protein [Bryobacteraceae bacterium]